MSAEKREPVTWITKNGKHIPIFADTPSEDEIRKSNQIKVNKFQAFQASEQFIKSGSNYENLTLEEKKQLIYDFDNRTGIHVRIMGIDKVPSDTLKMTLDTVENQLKKHGKDAFILTEVTIDANDFTSEENKDAYAQISPDGSLQLNPKYFTHSVSEITELYKRDVEGKHLVNGDASSIILHEMGHSRWNLMIAEICKKYGASNAEYKAMYNESCDKNWRFGEDLDLYEVKQAYYHFTEKLYDFQDNCLNSDYLKKKNNGQRPLLYLKTLCSPSHNNDDGISEYATTDIHEMMAEAWSDVMYNGENASWMSKQVVKEFLRSV